MPGQRSRTAEAAATRARPVPAIMAIPPVAVLLVLGQLHTRQTVSEGAASTVAALVGMVPQGLVLLTSIAFGAAAVTLALRRVLVQQLPADAVHALLIEARDAGTG